jgi:hypothetical protein
MMLVKTLPYISIIEQRLGNPDALIQIFLSGIPRHLGPRTICQGLSDFHGIM